MKSILKNWKTTALGAITIILSLLTSKGKIDTATASAITAGAGLILAHDGKAEGNE